MKISKLFPYHHQLEINLPNEEIMLSNFTLAEQQGILEFWEKCRGRIPDKMNEFEVDINQKQEELNNEMDFEKSCLLNEEIASLASKVNDLWLWYRTQPFISLRKDQDQ
ncbi:hypothetical protein [Bacillus sp. 2205SS5-2]|uniref:hypothetical protein n=1 Tax=Bacillus sp. 2205SS5-2 TaxID=3109031 RepID=UPI003004F524